MTTMASTAARPWRLHKQVRKGVLLAHIASAGTWLGLDIAMAVAVFTAAGTDDPSTKALAYQALGQFIFWPLLTSSVLCLASGVLLGLGTSYGLVRYRWVTIKLVLNIVLTLLVLFALRPGVMELADQGREVAAGGAVAFTEDSILFPPIVSLVALTVAFVLSTFKPFGRIRGR